MQNTFSIMITFPRTHFALTTQVSPASLIFCHVRKFLCRPFLPVPPSLPRAQPLFLSSIGNSCTSPSYLNIRGGARAWWSVGRPVTASFLFPFFSLHRYKKEREKEILGYQFSSHHLFHLLLLFSIFRENGNALSRKEEDVRVRIVHVIQCTLYCTRTVGTA